MLELVSGALQLTQTSQKIHWLFWSVMLLIKAAANMSLKDKLWGWEMDWTGVEQGAIMIKNLQVHWEFLENMNKSKSCEILGSHGGD